MECRLPDCDNTVRIVTEFHAVCHTPCLEIVVPPSMAPYDIRPPRTAEVQKMQEQFSAIPSLEIVVPPSMAPYDIHSIPGNKNGMTLRAYR